MNTDILYQYIADTLKTRLCLFRADGTLLRTFCCREEIFDLPAADSEAMDFLLEPEPDRLPSLSSVNQDFVYGTVFLPDGILLLGPLRVYTAYPFRRNLIRETRQNTFELSITDCDFDVLTEHVLLLHNLFHSPALTADALITANCLNYRNTEVETHYSRLVFDSQEEGTRHNSYSQECRMLDSIEKGDLKLLKSTFTGDEPQNMGTVAPTSDRNSRNLSICAITLISRAAIRGGMNPEQAFSLCDSYITQIENLKHPEDLKPLVEGAKLRFASLVRDLQEHRAEKTEKRRHPILEQAKSYIFSHLHEKIFLEHTAEELHVSSAYLSQLFRKYEGISFTDFVLREKISLVKNMLIYSPYSYIEIATYLGFCSQSHLGKQFKAVTGMTLKQFRDTYASTEFHADPQ